MHLADSELPDGLLDRMDAMEKRVLFVSQMHRGGKGTLPAGYDKDPLIAELLAVYEEARKLPCTTQALRFRARILVVLGLVPRFCRASRGALAEAKRIFHDLRRMTGDLIYEENARWCTNLARLYDYDEAIAALIRNGVLNND